MNISKIALDNVSLLDEAKPDVKPHLIKEEARLVKIIDAIRKVSKSEGWSTLKSEVFDNLVATLERQLRDEAKAETPDSLKLNRLAGQLKWAEKYSDLSKLEAVFSTQLQGIRQQLHGKSE